MIDLTIGHNQLYIRQNGNTIWIYVILVFIPLSTHVINRLIPNKWYKAMVGRHRGESCGPEGKKGQSFGFFNQFIDMQIKNTIDKKANFQCVQRQMLTMCLCAGIRLLCCDQGMRIEKSYAYAPKHRINRTTECWRKLFYNSVHKYHRIETVSAIFHILFTKRRLDWLAIVLMYNCTCVSQIHARAHCKPHRTNR